MKVLLVDDHALIRDALRGVLKELTDDAIVPAPWRFSKPSSGLVSPYVFTPSNRTAAMSPAPMMAAA